MSSYITRPSRKAAIGRRTSLNSWCSSSSTRCQSSDPSLRATNPSTDTDSMTTTLPTGTKLGPRLLGGLEGEQPLPRGELPRRRGEAVHPHRPAARPGRGEALLLKADHGEGAPDGRRQVRLPAVPRPDHGGPLG